jgi:hypothetical protein
MQSIKVSALRKSKPKSPIALYVNSNTGTVQGYSVDIVSVPWGAPRPPRPPKIDELLDQLAQGVVPRLSKGSRLVVSFETALRAKIGRIPTARSIFAQASIAKDGALGSLNLLKTKAIPAGTKLVVTLTLVDASGNSQLVGTYETSAVVNT